MGYNVCIQIEDRVLQLLSLWSSQSLFPAQYTQGLEALFSLGEREHAAVQLLTQCKRRELELLLPRGTGAGAGVAGGLDNAMHILRRHSKGYGVPLPVPAPQQQQEPGSKDSHSLPPPLAAYIDLQCRLEGVLHYMRRKSECVSAEVYNQRLAEWDVDGIPIHAAGTGEWEVDGLPVQA